MPTNPLPHHPTPSPKNNIEKLNYIILSALPEELSYFKTFFSSHKNQTIQIGEFEFKIYEYQNKKILLSSTGLGTAFTACAVTFLHYHFNPEFMLFSGTAGGIKTGIKLRDVIIAEKAFEAEIQDAFTLLKNTPFESCLTHPFNNLNFPSTYSASEKLLDIANDINFEEENVHKGTVATSNLFPAPKELFNKIKSQNPLSIDMETSAFYQIAWLLKIPALAVRGISNVLNDDGTDDNVQESDVKGSSEAAAKVVLKILNKLVLQKDGEQHISPICKDEINSLITTFNLEPHPEGGYFTLTYKSTDKVKSTDPSRYNNDLRCAGSSIYYLLEGNDFSAWHNLESDEIWHFYKGSAVKIHIINKQGAYSSLILGDSTKIQNASFQVTIKSGDWFAAENLDKSSYCLVGCTVSPAFEYADFKLADRKELCEKFPEYKAIIEKLTRVENTIENHLVQERQTFSNTSIKN